MIRLACIAWICGAWGMVAQEAAAPLFRTPPDLSPAAPAEFTRFHLGGSERQAQVLNRYLWHHFSTRSANLKTTYPKEWLTLADLWLAGALDPRRKQRIQEVHREDLLEIRVNPDGYVQAHQHFSHAHDHGWPFPLWIQVPGGFQGWTAGWHFQQAPVRNAQLWSIFQVQRHADHVGEGAVRNWELQGLQSIGILSNQWHLQTTASSPLLTSPRGVGFDAANAPFIQIRWARSSGRRESAPWIEWMRETDPDFAEERRIYFPFDPSDLSRATGTRHTLIPMHPHPLWNGKISRIRFSLAPGEGDLRLVIDSIFTCYDTRKTSGNPVFLLAGWNYFRWSGDMEFLQQHAPRMRQALLFQETVLEGGTRNHIRNTLPGHDGRPGFTLQPDGRKQFHPGRGLGNNYYDLLPFGHDDFYATAQYYASLLAVAEMEEAVQSHPEWNVPRGAGARDPQALRAHAEEVRRKANEHFWNPETGRFVACIDADGVPRDYGYVIPNLEAIWYGIATDSHARMVLDWISGRRIVEEDTSKAEDIYHFRFAPRISTRRNVDWYSFVWTHPETIPFGGQVQDGGAVLGFSFFDLWGRLQVYGPDDAWSRLVEILAWEEEVWAAGGYRRYYKDPGRGTLQGGGTAGGLGIDAEFHESSLLPAILVHGFLGLRPGADALRMEPRLPAAVPEIGVSRLWYRGAVLDLKAASGRIEAFLRHPGIHPVQLELPGEWREERAGRSGSRFRLEPGTRHLFVRVGS